MKAKSLLLLALSATIAISGCGSGPKPEAPKEEEHAAEKPSEGIKLTEEGRETAGVRTEAVAMQELQAGLEVPGTVSIPSNARATVTPPVAGKILHLFVDIGDRVGRGQALAEIQSAELAQASSGISAAESQASEASAEVAQHASAVDLARARYRAAQESLDRQRQFAAAGAFSQPSLAAAQNELNDAQTEQAAAKSALAGAHSRLDRAERLSREGLVAGADFDQAKLDVEQAQIRQDRASQRVWLAQRSYERESRMGRQGLQNAQQIQTAESEARAAKLGVDQAVIDLQGAKAALAGARRAVQNARASSSALRGGPGVGSTITLTAPIPGVVVERQATLGQAVERSSDLFDVEDAAVVWVTASVPESAVSRVRLGASVDVVTSAYPGRTFAGKVQLIGTKLDDKTRTLPVQCRVENSQGVLRAGLFTRVRIGTQGHASVIAVPTSALVGEGEEQAVFVDEDGKYERRKVKTGRRQGQRVEIVEGLKVGDRVAVEGVFVLESESKKDQLKGDED